MLYESNENNRFLFNMSFYSFRIKIKPKKIAVIKRTGSVP